MKRKQLPKREAVPLDLENVAAEVAEFERPFQGKTALHVVQTLAPKAKNVEGIACLFSGLGIDLGLPVPAWARAAARNAFAGLDIRDLEGFERAEPTALGKATGFLELVPQFENKLVNPELAKKLVQKFSCFAKLTAAMAPAQQSRQFFDARARAGNILERAKNPSQRTKVYLIISLAWPLIAEFKSAAQLHLWLIKQNLILPNTDPAETRKVCRFIGLKFPSKPGRRLKKEKSGH